MNGKKILNNLIIIFVIMNVVLYGMNLYNYKDVNRLSKERENHLVKVLNDKNISLNAELPKFDKMKELYFSRPVDREKNLIDYIFNGKERHSTYFEGVHTHTDDNETLIFNKVGERGRVFYSAKRPVYRVGNLPSLNKFISDFSIEDEQYIPLGHKFDDKNDNIYFFNEVYEDKKLFCNEIVIKVAGDGVIEARAIRYTPRKFGKESFSVIPVDAALYKLAYEVEFDEKMEIVDVSIGYYLEEDLIGNEYIFKSLPHYQVTMRNGVKYYINAVNGKIMI